MTENGGGVFWKRDTSYDDGYSQSGMCTYVASTFESGGMTYAGAGGYAGGGMHYNQPQVWQPNGDLINYTFIFEKTDAPPATDSFMQRVYADRRIYLTRVYAETRAYYIRKGMIDEVAKIDATIEQFGQSEVQFRAEKILKGAPAPESWSRK